jgi:hypothetical protein
VIHADPNLGVAAEMDTGGGWVLPCRVVLSAPADPIPGLLGPTAHAVARIATFASIAADAWQQVPVAIYDNWSQPAAPGNGGLLSVGAWAAEIETNALAVTLESIELPFEVAAPGVGAIVVTVRADVAGVPNLGAALWSSGPVPRSSLTQSGSLLVYAGSPGLAVSSSTKYWIMVTESGATGLCWAAASTSAGLPANLSDLHYYSLGVASENGEAPFILRAKTLGIEPMLGRPRADWLLRYGSPEEAYSIAHVMPDALGLSWNLHLRPA